MTQLATSLNKLETRINSLYKYLDDITKLYGKIYSKVESVLIAESIENTYTGVFTWNELLNELLTLNEPNLSYTNTRELHNCDGNSKPITLSGIVINAFFNIIPHETMKIYEGFCSNIQCNSLESISLTLHPKSDKINLNSLFFNNNNTHLKHINLTIELSTNTSITNFNKAFMLCVGAEDININITRKTGTEILTINNEFKEVFYGTNALTTINISSLLNSDDLINSQINSIEEMFCDSRLKTNGEIINGNECIRLSKWFKGYDEFHIKSTFKYSHVEYIDLLNVSRELDLRYAFESARSLKYLRINSFVYYERISEPPNVYLVPCSDDCFKNTGADYIDTEENIIIEAPGACVDFLLYASHSVYAYITINPDVSYTPSTDIWYRFTCKPHRIDLATWNTELVIIAADEIPNPLNS